MPPDSHRIALVTAAAVLGCTPSTPAQESPPQPRPSARLDEPVTSPAPPPEAPAPIAPDLALSRAAAWLAAFPEDRLRFDAAIVLTELARLHPLPDLERARERALARAERDADNPMRRFWDADARAPADAVHGWSASDERINTNRVVIEALHCSVHGWREQTEHYAAGPMRDDGGYRSTHALWALVIAQRQGCRTAHDEGPIVALAEELARHQPDPPTLATARDFDLYAERTLMVLLAREALPNATLPDPSPWVDVLLSRQDDEGTWGTPDPDNDYMQFHATMVSAWAIALGAAARPG